MARRTEIFEPDVTIGDLLLLLRLSELFHDEHVSNPGLALQAEWGVSATRVRNALLRIDRAVGPVELKGVSRRTQQPSLRGGNVGRAGKLGKLLIDISAHPRVDQSRLRLEIESVLLTMQKRYEDGEYNKVTSLS